MTSWRASAAFLLMMALSACSGTSAPKGADGEEPSSVPSTSDPSTTDPSTSAGSSPPADAPTRPAEARKVLARGVHEIVTEPVTGFTFTVFSAGAPVIVVDGFARADQWEVTGEFAAPGASASNVMHARSVGGSAWMQMEDWPSSARGCWLATEGGAPLGIQGLTPHEPFYISMLQFLRADGFADEPGTIAGHLELTGALGLLQAQLLEYIELSPSQKATGAVPVQIEYEGERLTTVRMSGTDVMTSIEDGGGKVVGQFRTSLEVLDFAVSYAADAAGDEVVPPPADLLMQDPSMGCH